MRKLAMVLMTALMPLGGTGCSWKMPKMPEVKIFEGERAEVKVQRQIGEALKAEDEPKYLRQVAALYELAKDLEWDNRRLLAQIVDYSGRVEGKKTEQLDRYYRLLGMFQVPRSTIVDVVAPRMANSEVSRLLLGWAAPPDPHGRVDFSHFQRYLEINRVKPPQDLVLWMYERDPAAAMWTMMAVYGESRQGADGRTAVLGEHVVSEILWRQQQGLLQIDEFDPAASEQLEALSKSKDWWVRLYAAEVLASHPRLRRGDVMQRLEKDANVIVAAAAARGTGK